jgi:hypothetical protein
MSLILDGTLGATFNDGSNQPAAASPYVLKNRIINGDMRIDQRNAGASVTPASGTYTYTLDRWTAYASQASKFTVQQNAGSVTLPAGYTNYLGVTSLAATTPAATDEYFIQQRIEGYNIADLGWGTANAKTVTLSFQVYSSLTGTFGGTLQNNAANRIYVFSYSIPVANIWTTISITIAGDTSGTWVTNNGIGIRVGFDIGTGSTYKGTSGSWGSTYYDGVTGGVNVIGTNGATWYITGVQLEIGTSATPFERRLYNQELANCQRYYWKYNGTNANIGGWRSSGAGCYITFQNPVDMRTTPSFTKSGTIAFYSYTVADASNITYSAIAYQSTLCSTVNFTTTGAGASANGIVGYTYGSGYIDISAEL